MDACILGQLQALASAATPRPSPKSPATLSRDAASCPRAQTKEIELLRAEIAAGRPTLALNAHNGSQWCVVTGYDPEVLGKVKDEDSPPGLICRSCYDDSNAEYCRTPCFPWEIRAIRKTSDPIPREDAVRNSLQRAVELIGTPAAEVTGGGGWFWHYKDEYSLGLAAYDAWAADLEDEAGIEALEPEHFMTYWQSCAYLYDQLHDSRRAAAEYLRRVGPVFGARPKKLLDEAADLTDGLVDLLTAGFPCFPFLAGGYRHDNGWYTTGEEHEDFRGHRIPAHAPEWPAEVRRGAVDLLQKAREKEEAILKLLGRGLNAPR